MTEIDSAQIQGRNFVNPHSPQPVSLPSLVKSLSRNHALISQMIGREVISRYKGSAMGLLWSFLNPVFMLVVYTVVFSEIFKSRWPDTGASESKTQFALILFVGLIILNFFSELLNKSPGLILGNVNYVKKVVFPLEILPIVSMGAAFFHCLVSLCVLLLAFLFFNGFLYWTVIFIPIVLLPFLIFTLGIAWILASLGVYLRDVGQTTVLITTVMMFLAPVFYPIAAVPEQLRRYIMANPLTFIIEQARDVLVFGRTPDWIGLLIYTAVSLFVAWIGYAWFQKTRKGFADVL